jgi:hypothetical protein
MAEPRHLYPADHPYDDDVRKIFPEEALRVVDAWAKRNPTEAISLYDSTVHILMQGDIGLAMRL